MKNRSNWIYFDWSRDGVHLAMCKTPPSISDSDECKEISDSLSKIKRHNKRILAKPSHSSSSDSSEISNTIHVGNQIGFKMNGKERDLKRILASGE